MNHRWLRLPTFMEPDRGTIADDEITVFGWIARKDGQRDFALICFDRTTGKAVWWATSSAKYSLPLHLFCGGSEDEHCRCVSARQALDALAQPEGGGD